MADYCPLKTFQPNSSLDQSALSLYYESMHEQQWKQAGNCIYNCMIEYLHMVEHRWFQCNFILDL